MTFWWLHSGNDPPVFMHVTHAFRREQYDVSRARQ